MLSADNEKKSRQAELRISLGKRITAPVAAALARAGFTPNAVTWIGFALTCGAAAIIVLGYPLWGGVAMLVGGVFDMFDGALARHTGRVTVFGGVLDSTLDRLSEAVLLLAVFIYANASLLTGLLAFLALVGSFMVSYIRARAEGAGLECKVGVFTRPERVGILALGLLLSGIDHALVISLAVLAAMAFFTAGQRLVCVWRQRAK